MPDWLTLHIAALVLVAALFGGMLTFAALFAPLIHQKLPPDTAAGFTRDVFPVYYRVMGILALVAVLPLVPAQAYWTEISMLVTVAVGFVFANLVLRPQVNAARDENRDARFKLLHKVSVLLNLAQFVVVTIVLIRLAQ